MPPKILIISCFVLTLEHLEELLLNFFGLVLLCKHLKTEGIWWKFTKIALFYVFSFYFKKFCIEVLRVLMV